VVASLQSLQDRFQNFIALLDANNHVLKIIGDMEEKSRGEQLYDENYIRQALRGLRSGVAEIIDRMIALGGPEYESLKARFSAINTEVERIFIQKRPIQPDAYTVPFKELDRDRAASVGSKNAQLGELKSKLGLPVPDGFAITAWAYKRFVDAGNLQARITEHLQSVDIKRYEDLARVSDSIQAMIASSPVPDDLAEAILKSCDQLARSSGSRALSVRSSAIGEDTLFSFAGQYRSFLNVRSEDVIERYRAVLASKFTPQAIYYFMSHALAESELAMSASCVAMIDAAASGVVYTRDPVQPEQDCVLVSAVCGLGKYLVDGRLTPDIFCVSRSDGNVRHAQLAVKPVRLVICAGGGTVEENVPEEEQSLPSVGEAHLRELAAYAQAIEEHYGIPQDIEWVVDRQGQLFLLQTRPLRVVRARPRTDHFDFSSFRVLRSGGTTVFPGAGCGPAYRVSSTRDLTQVPQGAVLIARNPFPGLVTAMGKIQALVTEVGSVASHMATLAREYQIPTLVGVERVADLAAGRRMTVDATAGMIYEGIHPELCAARQSARKIPNETPVFNLLRSVIARVSPLNLLHPSDPGFSIGHCRTFHDITRFAHQRAMDEMFAGASRLEQKQRVGIRLKTSLPLEVNIICIDRSFSPRPGMQWIAEEELSSVPMKAFWGGICEEGWIAEAAPADAGKPAAGLATGPPSSSRGEFSESSFAILGREYMIISLGLGYHFTTVEALCTPEPGKNYIRIQYKGGGAALDRRVRRVRLIMSLLSRLGFEHSGEGDFLDSSVAYLDSGGILKALHVLGRITMMTKQLDMALSNDLIAQWYTQDFLKKLSLGGARSRAAQGNRDACGP